jgi:hypothetical protein
MRTKLDIYVFITVLEDATIRDVLMAYNKLVIILSFVSNKSKVSKQDRQNRLKSPMSEEGEP